MQPWLLDNRPVPCIYDGYLAELMHHQGILGIVRQTAGWLQKAGDGSLIDPEQGWEPVRRDSFEDYFVADAQCLRSLVKGASDFQLRHFDYVRIVDGEHAVSLYGHAQSPITSLSDQDLPDILDERPIPGRAGYHTGRSLALIVWPGTDSSGRPHQCATYAPETVFDLTTLRDRAALYRCQPGLDQGISHLRESVAKYSWLAGCPLAIALLVRRPFHLIGTQSDVEICPYVTQLALLTPSQGNDAPVRPAAHLHTISRSLLAEMAGQSKASRPLRWSLIGAGSLGSKMAIHLARAGAGPDVVIDNAVMRPHNASRHALLPEPERRTSWTRPKAVALCDALKGLDQESRPITRDAAGIATDRQAREDWSRDLWAVVNSTASLSVREALAAGPGQSRVIETTLFGGGRIGLITVEGSGRNPSTTDLIAQFYAMTQRDAALRSAFGSDQDAMSRQMIGQGCGSLTTVISDGRLSLFAAGMAEYLLQKQRDGLPEYGEILVGRVSDGGLGLSWRATAVPPAERLCSKMADEDWSVHINDRAQTRIAEEAAQWGSVETGGVLIGRLSEASRTVHVVDVLDAPKDSSRSRNHFVLGTRGLSRSIDQYCDASGGSLYCLGTWHTHPAGGAPSKTDRDTAKAISVSSLQPALSLIYSPDGFQAYLADVVNKEDMSACSIS